MTLPPMTGAALDIGPHIVRIAANGLGKVGNRLIVVTLPRMGSAALGIEPIIRLDRDGSVEIGNGLNDIPPTSGRSSALTESPAVLRIKFESLG